MRQVEYLIIGVGTAGLGAYSRIRRKSKSLLLIQDGPFGTTCARVGCMPSKMLITAAELAHGIDNGEYFGVKGSYAIDGQRVFERLKQDRKEKFVGGVLKAVDKIPEEIIIRGRANFVSPNQVEVNGEVIQAEKIILACGSRPFIPPVFDEIKNHIDTSDTIFELDQLPQSIAVIGLGVIALELGQAFHRLGVKTTLFGHSGRIGPFTHPELQKEMLDVLSKELTIYPQGEINSAKMQAGAIALTFQRADGSEVIQSFQKVLVASGRESNLVDMNLEKSELQLDSRGLPLYDPQTMRCGDSAIFIAGDATEDLTLWHEAYDEGRIAADSALSYPDKKYKKRRVPLGIYFSDPQMAVVGRQFHQLDKDKIIIGKAPFAKGPRHEIYNIHHGQFYLYVDKSTGKIEGAEIFGKGAEHFAHYLALAISQNLTVHQVLEAPFYHPCLEEVMKAALNKAMFQL
jgi:dihydrolipoamide dehydrogenase